MKPGRVGSAIAVMAAVALAALGGLYFFNAAAESRVLTLATTTSTYDSGLLDALIPPFERAYGCRVDIIAVGTGQALELGRTGDVDVILVHSPASELRWMAEGHGSSRRAVMYNDFVIVGSPRDPAGLAEASDLRAALSRLAEAGAAGNALFLSRGDDSGTYEKEVALWSAAGIKPASPWYEEVGAGMGDTLRLAADRGAYTLSDRGTYLALYGPGSGREGRLAVSFEGDPDLHNPYHVMVVSPAAHPGVNAELAEEFAAYLVSEEARRIISTFGVDRFGQPLFQVLEEDSGRRKDSGP